MSLRFTGPRSEMPFSVIMMGGFPYSSLIKLRILLNPKGETFSQEEPESSQLRSAIVPAPLINVRGKHTLIHCVVKQTVIMQQIFLIKMTFYMPVSVKVCCQKHKVIGFQSHLSAS